MTLHDVYFKFLVIAPHHKMPLIVWYAVSLHLFWSIAISIQPLAVQATAPYILNTIFGHFTALLLAIGAMSAMIGLVTVRRYLAVIFMLPQQLFLFISAVGASQAIVNGHFADGVERPRMFIAVDQEPAILVALFYTIGIIQMMRAKHA
jgi:hypothetical protein